MTDRTLLIGDIGGTNARFALADPDSPGFSDEQTLQCAEFATADDAIQQYLADVGAKSPEAICLAAAGPIVDDHVRFTNNPWTISIRDLRETFAIDRVRLLNDFEAIGYSVPFLSEDEAMPVGLPETDPLGDHDYTIGVVGPGTGLGAVGLLKSGDQYFPIAGEASHGGFAPETQVQLDILTMLRDRFDRVSSERLVSGQGIENLYWALTQIHGDRRGQLSAAEIFAASMEDNDPRASEAVETFFEILGQFAGDYALALGAEGIFIAGGIVRRYPDKLANSRFRSGFESKGRHRSLMERIPTRLILHEQPGLLGAAYCAMKLAGG
ncbi:MAG: glucokinase [Woeseiaceae bacterium]|nr:glucokinase [Woeseiaceae bacterium]